MREMSELLLLLYIIKSTIKCVIYFMIDTASTYHTIQQQQDRNTFHSSLSNTETTDFEPSLLTHDQCCDTINRLLSELTVTNASRLLRITLEHSINLLEMNHNTIQYLLNAILNSSIDSSFNFMNQPFMNTILKLIQTILFFSEIKRKSLISTMRKLESLNFLTLFLFTKVDSKILTVLFTVMLSISPQTNAPLICDVRTMTNIKI